MIYNGEGKYCMTELISNYSHTMYQILPCYKLEKKSVNIPDIFFVIPSPHSDIEEHHAAPKKA